MKLIFILTGGIYLAYLLISGKIGLILPFIISYIAGRIFRPIGVYLSKKCHVGEKLGCAVLSTLVLTGVIWSAVSLFYGMAGVLDRDMVSLCISEVSEAWDGLLDSLPFHVFGNAERVRGAVMSYSGELLSDVCTKAAGCLTSFAASLPSFALSAVICAVSFFYFMCDMDGAESAFFSLISERYRKNVVSAFRNVSEAIFGYIRGAMLISLVTLTLLFIGFLVIRIDRPAHYALFIAIADTLPLIGCGMILIPWGVFRIIRHETVSGIAILVLYCVIWGVRQYLEPRILGRMMGIEPVVMLALVYIGWSLGGFTGVIILTSAVYTINNAQCEIDNSK